MPRALSVVLVLVLALIAIKAASADLTWDEAWTYLFYGRSPLGFLKLDYANDHPFNSLLIWAATRIFGNSELAIRTPNVLAAALYLYSSALLIGRVRLKALAFALCVLNPYLFDYFALGRGYGIAAALVQYGLVARFFPTEGRRGYVTMLAACLLASLSVFSTVVVLYAIMAAELVTDRLSRAEPEARPSRTIATSIPFAALGLLAVSGLLWVSREGLPLYGSTDWFFDAVPRSLARMYVSERWSGVVAVLGIAAIAALILLGFRRFGRRSCTLLLGCAIGLGATWIAARGLGKPLPTGRLLVPWVPLFNLTLISMTEDLRRHAGRFGAKRIALASWLLCAVLAAIWLGRLHFQRYADWPQDYRLQARLAQALASGRGCLPPDVWDRYGHLYYLTRWFPADHVPDPPRCPSP